MSAPFEAASYLFRSERRVRALELLAGEPRTPGELAAETDASRKTVRRALGRFEEFGWVRRTDRRYEVTEPGRAVADRAHNLLGTVDAAATLCPVARWLPASFDIDVGDLADVRVTVPETADTAAPARRMVEVIAEAETVRAVAFAVAPGAVEATRHSDRVDLVLAPEAVAFVADDPELRPQFRTMLAAGWGVRRFDGDLAYNLVVADETVMVGLVDESGAPSGLVESTDEDVREWADEQFEHYHDRAEPLDPERFGE